MDNLLANLNEIRDSITKSYDIHGGINRIDREDLPVREKVNGLLEQLFVLLFPGYFGNKKLRLDNLEYYINGLVGTIYIDLKDQIEKALIYNCKIEKIDCEGCSESAKYVSRNLLERIPLVREKLKKDVQAAYEGDPAATNTDEIISCYPGIEAVATYRLAHEIYVLGIPLIPRMMTENAHRNTGIDIHPGARIGDYFFIDHGTGVVIGETTYIGNRVKIYQGVTLGALSFPKNDNGDIIKGTKRHPNIEDDVVIYSGATILGGETVIGKGSVIGANTWITDSVPPNSKVVIDVKQEMK